MCCLPNAPSEAHTFCSQQINLARCARTPYQLVIVAALRSVTQDLAISRIESRARQTLLVPQMSTYSSSKSFGKLKRAGTNNTYHMIIWLAFLYRVGYNEINLKINTVRYQIIPSLTRIQQHPFIAVLRLVSCFHRNRTHTLEWPHPASGNCTPHQQHFCAEPYKICGECVTQFLVTLAIAKHHTKYNISQLHSLKLTTDFIA
jgi:hypothetical protein